MPHFAWRFGLGNASERRMRMETQEITDLGAFT